MLKILRRQACRLTLFLGVVLTLLHGPMEYFHHALHAQVIAAHTSDTSAVEPPAEPCPLCALAALPITLPVAERLLSEPLTQPILFCQALTAEEQLRRASQRFDPLRAPPSLTC